MVDAVSGGARARSAAPRAPASGRAASANAQSARAEAARARQPLTWGSALGWSLRQIGRGWGAAWPSRLRGGLMAAVGLALMPALASYRQGDPSLNTAAAAKPLNLLGGFGAVISDVALQTLGLCAPILALVMVASGLVRAADPWPHLRRTHFRLRLLMSTAGIALLAAAFGAPPPFAGWPFARGLGGLVGDGALALVAAPLALIRLPAPQLWAGAACAALGLFLLARAIGVGRKDLADASAWIVWRGGGAVDGAAAALRAAAARRQTAGADEPEDEAAPPVAAAPAPRRRRTAASDLADQLPDDAAAPWEDLSDIAVSGMKPQPVADERLEVVPPKAPIKDSGREARESQKAFGFVHPDGFQLPELAMLAKPKPRAAAYDEQALRQNAKMLEGVLAEFGVKGVIDQIRPGPVVTLYELVPAPGVKSSRVISLSDDIARSMSARSARVSVVSGRNAIGIELPNQHRETVYLRDLLSSPEYEKRGAALPMALGETIGGEPYIADLSKMPHLLIAGTTGSGKSVGVNAMILSILYRLPPSECRFIMIDPKMLELSVYDGIPHLLAPVVTDPKKAIVALKWTVREMENRYRLMSKIGVRNVAGYNDKAREAISKGERFERTVQTGFDEGGRPIYETEEIRPEPMPYLVVVIDEVADLMMVAGKDIEGAVQRLAQMARAAGIHLIMATQRPSVDVITGTIKANFPTRISFQVTSKIDARTILGEQGAEQLLGQGDMLYMAGGGRVTRLHGPFVGDNEVEDVAKFLRSQGQPQYLEAITAAPEDDEDGGGGGMDGEGSPGDLYDQAVAVVTRDRKASTSYVQRRLQIGYNRAASLIERMEKEGVVGAANHAGKRDILAPPPPPL
ncbi:DNA translocase FtsK 4TM domain-containing protein [soil metagenome]